MRFFTPLAGVAFLSGLTIWSPSALVDHAVQAQATVVPAAGPGVSVVTLNMARETDVDRILADFRRNPTIEQADIWLLQEVMHPNGGPDSVAHDLAKRLGVFVTSSPAYPGVSGDGLAILSRYPLSDVFVRRLPTFDLRFRSRSRQALAATVQSPSGPLRVYNAHLDTRINARDRVAQILPVIDDAAAWNGPRLIGGDFNTSNFRWVYNVMPVPMGNFQGRAVYDAMTERGFSTAFRNIGPTFDHFGFHLDWIYTRELETRSPEVVPIGFSDHHALLLKVNPSRN
ncbi:MAG TPA: endonuclease/exonuclease/phosphatase family protein [Bryobacteraceae bacterium]|nr:endonuclease/exonuclease/phosphatase family protein [Bryobacteraceae bacterium]